MMNDLEQKRRMIERFKKVRDSGWFQSERSNNTGIGKTFEEAVGVQENNSKGPDLFGYEIKTHREDVTSPVTLCTQKPSYPNKANERLKNLFGEKDSEFDDIKVLHVSMFGNRHNSVYGLYSFKLENDRQKQRLYIRVYRLSDYKLLDGETYYNYDVLKEKFDDKLKKLFYVEADRSYNNKGEIFHFKSAEIYTEPSFNKFLDLIDDGTIQYDIRLGAYKSGVKYGMPHDHGSGFRIRQNQIYKLYGKVEKI